MTGDLIDDEQGSFRGGRGCVDQMEWFGVGGSRRRDSFRACLGT